MDIKQQINKTIGVQLDIDPDEIRIDHSIQDDLGADSLDYVELIMRLEEDLDCEIQDSIAEKWETVGDVYDHFEE